jgi:hypothetical protein
MGLSDSDFLKLRPGDSVRVPDKDMPESRDLLEARVLSVIVDGDDKSIDVEIPGTGRHHFGIGYAPYIEKV